MMAGDPEGEFDNDKEKVEHLQIIGYSYKVKP